MNESDAFVKSLVLPSLVLVAVMVVFFSQRIGLEAPVDIDEKDEDDTTVVERPDKSMFDDIEEFDEPEPRVEADPVPKEEAPPEGTRVESDRFDDFIDQFRDYYDQQHRRMIHVTIDRPMYRPGQILRWRSWHLEAGSFAGAESDEATVALVSPRDEVVDEVDVDIESGMTDGQFEFDEEARGGEWTLRLSDGDEEYERPVLVSHFEPPRFRQQLDFSKRSYRPGDEVRADLEIVRDTGEPLRGHTIEGYLQVEGRHIADVETRLDGGGRGELSARLPERIREEDAVFVVTVEEAGMVETEIFPVPLALEEVQVTFQPEGGELVQELTSRIYFEARDLSGEPVDVTGTVVDSEGVVVADVETEHRGRGRFELRPEQGERYELVVGDPEGVEERFSLPAANSEGCVMRVYDDFDAQHEAVRTGVWCSKGRLVGMVAAMGDEIVDTATMVASPDEPAVAYLQPEDDEQWPRPAGTVRISVFLEDDVFDPVAERVAFRGRRAQLDLRIHRDREVYHPGETVELELEAVGPDGEPVLAELAKAVVDDRVHARAHHEVPSILAQLLLKSDDLHFWGDVDEADEYFDLYEEQAARGLDLLMGVRGWRKDDERDAFFVDGGDEKIEKWWITVVRRQLVHRPRQERVELQAEPAPEMAAGGGVGDVRERLEDRMPQERAESVEVLGALAVGEPDASREMVADEEAAPAPDDADKDDAGAAAPVWARDDDAAAYAAWEPVLKTGSDGRVTYSLELPEAIGAYRISVDGVAENGLVGTAEDVVPVEVPLSAALRMPEIMSGGDQLQLPITVRNTTDVALDTEVELSSEGPVSIDSAEAAFSIEVPPKSTATHFATVHVEDARGEGVVRVQAQGGGFTDGAQRSFEIEPRGYDRNALFSGRLPGHDRHDAPLDGMTDVGATADFVAYPSPVAEALEGMETMSRRPTGCFEQASGSNHPNVLVWQYLKAAGDLDGAAAERLEGHIEQGYQLLSSYEIDGGGFEWFGRPPAQAALSAWGLVQFTAMQEIVDGFDDARLDRTVEFLRSLQADDGSWDSGNRGAWQRISPSNRTPAQLLVIFGLARVGETQGFDKQLDDAAHIARESDDLYEIALATAALASADYDADVVDRAMSRLLERQDADGGWSPKSGRSWTWGYGNSFDVETTGLAALALIEGGGSASAIANAIDWLGRRKTARGWWGSTQATVMALEARIAYEREGLDVAEGAVRLRVDGETVEEARLVTGQTEPVRIADIGQYLSADTGEISVQSDLAVDYDFELDWRVEQFDVDGGGPLAVEFQIGDGQSAQMGDEVSVGLQVANREDDRLGMVVARVALPAGVEVGDRELDALVERSAVDLYETTGRDVILYFEDMDGAEEHRLRFSATAAVPGVFEVPASVAYPYYRDEQHWQWGERSQFRIHPGR